MEDGLKTPIGFYSTNDEHPITDSNEIPPFVSIIVYGWKLLTLYNVNIFIDKHGGVLNIQDQLNPSKGIVIQSKEFTKKEIKRLEKKIKLWFKEDQMCVWEKHKKSLDVRKTELK